MPYPAAYNAAACSLEEPMAGLEKMFGFLVLKAQGVGLLSVAISGKPYSLLYIYMCIYILIMVI